MIQHNLSPSIIDNDLNNQQPFRIKPLLQLRAVLSNQTASELTFKRSFNDLNKMQQYESIDKLQQKINLNNYILYEPDSASEVYGQAFHTVKKQSFLWKKFSKKDYMKRLESYLIMDCSTNIHKFVEFITDSTNQFVYTIYDAHFGDLHSHMKEKKRLDEPEARFLFRQCVEVVDECHQNGIIVRDIKLKKFVFLNQEKTKLGLSNLEDCIILENEATDDLIRSQQGCPAYVSPEVLNSQQQSNYSGRLSDSWSLGVILFTLLLGRYPFHNQSIPIMFTKIASCKFQIPPSSGLSLDARILIRSLIRVQPDERLLPSEILSTNWFKQAETKNIPAFNHLYSLSSNLSNQITPNQRKVLVATASVPLPERIK